MIQVKQIDLLPITYDNSSSEFCAEYIPEEYLINGFNPNETDMILIVV